MDCHSKLHKLCIAIDYHFFNEVAIDTGAQVATSAIKYLFPPMNYTKPFCT